MGSRDAITNIKGKEIVFRFSICNMERIKVVKAINITKNLLQSTNGHRFVFKKEVLAYYATGIWFISTFPTFSPLVVSYATLVMNSSGHILFLICDHTESFFIEFLLRELTFNSIRMYVTLTY